MTDPGLIYYYIHVLVYALSRAQNNITMLVHGQSRARGGGGVTPCI